MPHKYTFLLNTGIIILTYIIVNLTKALEIIDTELTYPRFTMITLINRDV